MPDDQKPIVVDTPDGGTATFPFGTDPAVITAVLAKHYPKDWKPPPPPKEKTPPPDHSTRDLIADALPDVMGAAGGLAASLHPATRGTGPAGSATAAGVMGAAGEGYKQLIKHGGELVPRFLGGGGAIGDVASQLTGWRTPEARAVRDAAWRGGGEGMTQGLTNAFAQGANQAGQDLLGHGIGRGFGVGGRVMGRINASPIARNVVSKAVAPAVGAVMGGWPGAAVGMMAANPITMRATQAGMGLASRVPPSVYSLLTRLLDPVGMRDEEEEQ